jgi:hypothetical protein
MVDISERIRQHAGIGANAAEAGGFSDTDDQPISLE